MSGIDEQQQTPPGTPAGGAAETALDDRTQRCLRLFEEDPAGLPAFRSAEELLKAAGAWTELLGVYRRRTEVIANRAERALLFGRIGHILETRLARTEEAADAYRQALGAHPGDTDVRRRLERILESSGRWDELASMLEAVAPRLKSRVDRHSAYLRLAELYQSSLDRHDAAIAAYERALEADPGRVDAFDALADLLERLGRHAELARHLEAWAARHAEATPLLARAAGIYARDLEGEPGSIDRAIACHERILEIAGDDSPAGEAARSRAALVDLYRRAERWEPLASALAQAAAAGPEGPAEEAQRERAGILEDKLRDPAGALAAWRALLERRPDDPDALAAAERLARAAGDGAALADVLDLRERAGLFESDAEAAALCEERATILEGLGGREEDAAAALERLLDRDPARAGALQRLCDLYDRMDRPGDRARKLLKLAGALPGDASADERAGAWREAARALEAVGEIERAIDAYRKSRELLPEDRFVLARLQELHAGRGEVADAREAAAAELDALCDGAPDRPGIDPERERILLERVAEGATALGRTDEAIACWEALLSRDPAHRGALRALAPFYEKNGDDEGLLSVIVKASQIEEAPATKQVLLLRAGELYESTCEDPEEATACYEQVLAIDPASEPAIDGLQRLYPALERWEALADLLAARADLAEGEARGEILVERACILEAHLSDTEGAARDLESALDADSDRPDTLQALADLYRKLERWPALESLLGREAALTEDAARCAEIAAERAALWEGPLGDPARAVALWEEVLAGAPDNADARERLLASHEAAGRWAEVARLLEDELARDPAPERALALRLALGEAWEEKLGRPEKALDHYRAAAEAAPGNGEARSRLHRALARSDAWEELTALMHAEADRERETSPYAWGDALVEIARIREEALDDPAGAEALLREVIAAVPEHAGAQARLFRRLESRGDLAALDVLIESSFEVSENQAQRIALAREALRVALARESSERAGPERAIAACKRLIDLGEEDDEVLRALCARLEAGGRFKELLEALTRRLAAAEGKQSRLDVALQLASLWEERFHRADQALALYRQARQIEPASLPALRGMARLCEREERWEELLGVLEALADEEPDPRARAAASYRFAVALHERFGRDHDALGHLERALELDGGNEDARDLLERLARTHRRHRTLARILKARIEALPSPGGDGEAGDPSPARRAALCERLGDLLSGDLNEPEDAAAAYRDALAAADDAGARLRVGLKLESICVRTGDARTLEAIYPRLIEGIGEPEDAGARREAAGLWARFGDHLLTDTGAASREAEAARAYGRACELDPDGAIRFEERRRLLERAGAQADLARHLEARAERLGPGAGAASLLTAAGQALAAAGNSEDAERRYRRALEMAPDGEGAHDALARLLASQDRSEDLAAHCERRIPLVRSAAEERALRLRAAGMLRDLPGGCGRALAHYRRALDLGPPDPDLLRAVADLSLLADDAAGAVEALERYLELPPPREQLVFVLSTLARLWEESLGRTGRAVDYCRMWIEADPGSEEGKDRLERLLEARGAWMELARLLESRLSGRDAGTTARLRKLARIHETRLPDAHRALDAWQRVLAVEPGAPDALNAVADAAPALGRWREAAAAIDRLIADTLDPARRGGLRRRQAELLAPHPAERARAIDQLQALLDEDPTPEQAAWARPRLRDLLEREGRFEEAFRLLQDMIEAAEEREKAALYAALGETAESRLWRYPEAVEAYEAWLAREPENIDCMRRLQKLHRRLLRWSDLAAMLRRERDGGGDFERRLALTLDLAAIEEERLGSPAGAAAELERAVELAPDRAGTLQALQRIYRNLQEHEKLHRTLGRELALEPPAARLSEICLERARLEAGPLGRPEDALGSYARAAEAGVAYGPVLEELAGLQARLGRHADHLATLGRLCESLSEDSARSAVLARMGKACEEAGDPRRAIGYFEQAVSLDPAMASSLRSLRRLYESEEDFSGAAAAIERLIACTPEGRVAAALAAELGEMCLQALQDPPAAEAWHERAIALDDRCLDAHARLGEIRFEQREFEAARKHLARALALEEDPRKRRRTARLALLLGLSQMELGEPDAAIRALTKATRLEPALTEAWQALGRVFLEAKEWASARDALTRVANAQGVAVEARTAALHGIARAEQALGRPETGLVAVDGALAADPDRFELLLLRAEMLQALDRASDAATAWRDAARTAPDDGWRAEALYRGAEILQGIENERSRAVGWYREAIAANPDHPGTLRRLADHALDSGSWREAGAYLESLTGLREDARDQADLGRVWWEGFGEEQNALACLRRAIELPGDRREAVDLAVRICDEVENWPRLAAFIEAYREQEAPSASQLPLLARLAGIYSERLYDPDAAARTLRAMMALAPDDLDIRERLAATLSGNAETYGEAASAYRGVIAAAPLRGSAWRGLAGVYWFQRRLAGCRDAATVLALLGEEGERAWADETPAEPPTSAQAPWRDRFAGPGPLRDALALPDALAPLAALLDEAWALLLPQPPAGAPEAALGARRDDLDTALGRWGIPGLPVLALSEPGEPLVLVGGDRLAIGAREEAIAALSRPVWKFFCHRLAARIALAQGPAGLDGASLGAALAALGSAAGLASAPGAPADERFALPAQQAVTWRNRRKVRRALEALGDLDERKLAGLATAYGQAASRAALIAGGDIAGALAGVAVLEGGRTDRNADAAPLGAAVVRSSGARDLLRFIAGERYLAAVEPEGPVDGGAAGEGAAAGRVFEAATGA